MKYFKKATYLDPTSELASLGLYLSYLDLGKSEDAIAELKRYLEKCPAKRYITTLEELLVDLKNGYATNYESIILELAKKNNVFFEGFVAHTVPRLFLITVACALTSHSPPQ